MAFNLESMLKKAGIDMDDIAKAKEQAAVVRQFIEGAAANMAAIAERLAAIDNGLAQIRDKQLNHDAYIQATNGKLGTLAAQLDELPKLIGELRQAADLVE